VLRLDREIEGFFLIQIGGFPNPFEQVEAKVASERFLDHVAVPASRSRGFHTHCAKSPLVEGDRRSCLRHARIIAS